MKKRTKEAVQGVITSYLNYENKVTSADELIDSVRDLYYIYQTKMTYEEYLESKAGKTND